jgi:hypothetical protein
VNPWYNFFVGKAIVDRDMAFNSVHCLVRQVKRKYMATFLSPTLPAKTLWKKLDYLEVRDGDDATLNFCPYPEFIFCFSKFLWSNCPFTT